MEKKYSVLIIIGVMAFGLAIGRSMILFIPTAREGIFALFIIGMYLLLRRKNYIMALIVTGVIGCGFALGAYLALGVFSPQQAAQIVIHDRELGNRAVDKCKSYGDQVLPYLRAESDNFNLINQGNAHRVADILGATKTEASLIILRELYSRKEDYPRLVGAIGLAMHGKLEEPASDNAFLINCLNSYVRALDNSSKAELAIIAMGKSANKEYVPYLIKKLLKPEQARQIYGYIIEAFGDIGDKQAIEPLKEFISNSSIPSLKQKAKKVLDLLLNPETLKDANPNPNPEKPQDK
jgi:hypothetical protein